MSLNTYEIAELLLFLEDYEHQKSIDAPWYKSPQISLTDSPVDIIEQSTFHFLKYNIVLWNDVEEKTTSFELNINRIGSQLEETVSNKIGRSIRFRLEVELVDSMFKLKIINLESFDLSVQFIRSKLG